MVVLAEIRRGYLSLNGDVLPSGNWAELTCTGPEKQK